jgi:cell division protein FtsI (penicillin-binding protein 3)
MVSAIANGGVYMPPHVLLQSADEGGAQLKPAAFHPENELPSPLPDGAHRVIKELTAAKMRSMMEGIVTEGTGRNAALNGYSAGGKTGTAQKVDPVTHTYSHTNLVASFAGFAPVSSPVFREIAQQVLEYLGVPHDQPLKTQKELAAVAKPKPDEDAPSENIADLNAMFDEVNHLPADDPLRKAAESAGKIGAADAAQSSTDAEAAGGAPAISAQPVKESSGAPPKTPRIFAMLPKKVLAAFSAENDTDANGNASAALHSPPVAPAVQTRSNGSVVVDAGQRVAVPSFSGDALRDVVEKAATLGLRVQPLGSGLAHEQAPAAGTMVPAGTEVVVRFAR